MQEAFSTAEARARGLTRRNLRSQDWTRVGQGIYRQAMEAADAHRFEQRLRDILPALDRTASFAHLTAAKLYGLWIPQLPAEFPLLASIPPGADRPERPGLYVFRSRAGDQSHRVVNGFRVVTPQVCIGQLAEDLSVLDLTIAIDSVLQLGLCTIVDIETAIRSRQRGLPRLRPAIPLSDGRSESAWETILRLIHVQAGIPVEPQARILDEFGRIVARADLRVRGTRRLSEYDGAVHRERAQHESDLRRDKALARLGFERYGYIASELLKDPGRVIRDAENALGWRHEPSRVLAWNELAHPSTLTKDGLRRFRHRLHRFD